MKLVQILTIWLVLLSGCNIIAQQTAESTDEKAYDIAVRPTQAAFYSAVLPGLGQMYNRDYWQVPVVYAALGGSVFYWMHNQKRFDEYRELYKQKKIDEESVPQYSFDWLERAQKYYKKKKDLAMMISVGVYALQIVWASVEAHLDYFDTGNELGFEPVLMHFPDGRSGVAFGCGVQYNF